MGIDVTTRKIKNLEELKPGDHIRVKGGSCSSFSSSKSSSFSSSFSFSKSSSSKSPTSSSSSKESGSSSSSGCSSSAPYTHHLLVVKVIDNKTVRVIHKNDQGVIENNLSIEVEAITVLEYDCIYKGKDAVERARDDMPDEDYDLVNANCEHFVFEVRTGEKNSMQVSAATKGLTLGCGAGASIGSSLGASSGGASSGSMLGLSSGASCGTKSKLAIVNK